MNNLVSVIIPIYNQEEYLDRSITSVLSQSYRNIEIVCVNDGSSDSSRVMLEQYSARDSRIKIVDQENSGLVHAVVTGVEYSRGKYICFLDSDDYMGENYIDFFIKHIDDADFIAASHYIDTGKEIINNKIANDKIYSDGEMQYLVNSLVWDVEKRCLSKNILNSRWNKMYTSDCVKSFMSQYDDCRNLSFGEDTLFTYFLLKNAKKCKLLTELNSYYYNIGNDNSMMTREKIEGHILKAASSFLLLKEQMRKNGDPCDQAYAMYFYLIESLFQRLEYQESELEFKKLFRRLKKDRNYQKALMFLIKNSTGKRKIVFLLRKIIPTAFLYKILFKLSK